jgi:hypothetical protein
VVSNELTQKEKDSEDAESAEEVIEVAEATIEESE